jgi:hypothetical protein
MTVVLAAPERGTAARDAAAIGRSLARGLAWLRDSYAVDFQAFAHHQAPPAVPAAVFAVTFAALLMFLFRGRKRPAAA